MVGGNMSLVKAWDDTVDKLKGRLSKWKLKTLSIGGRLTILKSVLGSTPIYNMSLYKVPKTVLNSMEAIRRKFFNGIHDAERKVAWVKWSKVLASKNQGGLGVSSFYALNRALLVKWVWRFLSHDNSLWARVIYAMHDRWIWDMNGDGVSRVKDVRILLDEVFLPNDATHTRWIKSIPIRVNIFAWKLDMKFKPSEAPLSANYVPASPDYFPISDPESHLEESSEEDPSEDDSFDDDAPEIAKAIGVQAAPAPLALSPTTPALVVQSSPAPKLSPPRKRVKGASSGVQLDVLAETAIEAKLDDHSEMIGKMYEYLLDIPLTRLETTEHDLEASRARLVSFEQEIASLQAKARAAEQRDEISQDRILVESYKVEEMVVRKEDCDVVSKVQEWPYGVFVSSHEEFC
uniref:RNA-directed DNA polymerase, eukaryota n=1 Tax=Tanacetum cinerariifolium TaxID=118510 RepID=A0A6L2K1C0_TANCI|nr:RNA-directed DNA polymerase, eukaryota [Tanacetum cinerariifolium]